MVGLEAPGSAAGAASVYNLRLPPKASGKGTGVVAGARILRLTPDSRAPAKQGAGITFGYHRRPPARARASWPAPGF